MYSHVNMYCYLSVSKIFAGEVSLMNLAQRLWWWMPWRKLRKNCKSLFWGMTRKEWLFSWQSLIKSTRSMYRANFCLFISNVNLSRKQNSQVQFPLLWSLDLFFASVNAMYSIFLREHIILVVRAYYSLFLFRVFGHKGRKL